MPIASSEFVVASLENFVLDLTADGKLVPSGGAANTVLTKSSTANGALKWATVGTNANLINTTHKVTIFGTGSVTEFVIVHNKNADVMSVSLINNVTSISVDPTLYSWTETDANTLKIIFFTAPTSSDAFIVRALFG
ncbi:MAG: hypothetical protein LBD57_04190 [Endomicrobium sp.]|jgi:hypothetical protein|uniref:hypothetical protein n=1 Tax=Candidatus Endomicrobiellum cubanum TaxID=3242325 RepID=UPI002837BBE0|nr:hypothetical protein [Endomicrobium sp.]